MEPILSVGPDVALICRHLDIVVLLHLHVGGACDTVDIIDINAAI